MKKALFVSFSFAGEGVEHGVGNNGATEYTESLCEELKNRFDLTVITDVPERFPGCKTLSLFNRDQGSREFDSFWKRFFQVYKANERVGFSRDFIYRLVKFSQSIDSEKLDDFIQGNSFDVVFFNRHDVFILAALPLFGAAKKVFIAHDVLFRRRLSYESHTGTAQPLTKMDRAIEAELFSLADCIVSISTQEQKYIQEVVPDKKVFLIRPKVRLQRPLSVVRSPSDLRFYFVGVNNFVNRNSLRNAVKTLGPLLGSGASFSVFGTVDSSSLFASSERVQINGFVPNLRSALAAMNLLVAPIEMGSGVPIKVADALSLGHFVLTSEFGAESFPEFLGTRLHLIDQRPEKSIDDIMRIESQESMDAYREYEEKFQSGVSQLCKELGGGFR